MMIVIGSRVPVSFLAIQLNFIFSDDCMDWILMTDDAMMIFPFRRRDSPFAHSFCRQSSSSLFFSSWLHFFLVLHTICRYVRLNFFSLSLSLTLWFPVRRFLVDSFLHIFLLKKNRAFNDVSLYVYSWSSDLKKIEYAPMHTTAEITTTKRRFSSTVISKTE